MLLLGVADCCWIIHRFAFTDSGALLAGGVVCFDLRAVAPSKRQTNGNLPAKPSALLFFQLSPANIEHIHDSLGFFQVG
jgi:hypothetical protein